MRVVVWCLVALLAVPVLLASPGAAQGVTLRMLMEDVPETHIIADLLPDFTAKTGIKVQFETVQYGDMHTKLVPQLVGSQSQYDALEVDVIWAGEFPAAGWLEPLQPYVTETKFDLSPYLKSMRDIGTWNGTLYMIPMYNYAMGLIYRTDLLNDAKLKAAYKKQFNRDLRVPQSLDEYVQVSKFMTKNAGLAGAAMQGARGDPVYFEWANYLFAAGGDYHDGKWNFTINNAAGRKALQLYVDNIRNAAPKGALSFNLDDTFRVMSQGKSWSMITYWWMLPQLNDPAKSKAAGKVALAPTPGGVGANGGWWWAIPKNSTHKKEAWAFINWVESKEIVKKRALAGHAPTRQDAFSDPDVLKKYPYYRVAGQIIAKAKWIPIFPFTAESEDVLGRELSLAAAGQKSVEQALNDAVKGLNALAAKAGLRK